MTVRKGDRCFRCGTIQYRNLVARRVGSEEIALCVSCVGIVESTNCHSLADIIATREVKQRWKKEPELPAQDTEETFTRPAWHKRVYGGCRE